MSDNATFLIYGASDDLVEVEGAVREEYGLGASGTQLRLTAPDGQSLDVLLDFGAGPAGAELAWTIGVYAASAYPDWPIRFGERPGYEGDPAVTIEAPADTTIEDVTP